MQILSPISILIRAAESIDDTDTFAKISGDTFTDTFDDATCDRNYVGLPRYFLTIIIKNDIIDDSLTRKTNSKIHNVYYKTTKNFESVWKTVILIISIYKMFET